MSWMTWEVDKYLYFLPFILVIFAWNRASLFGLIALGLAIFSYPFLMPLIGNVKETPGGGGYETVVSSILWLAAVGLFVLSVIAKALRIWDNYRRRQQ